MSTPLEDYALIGDCCGAGLVSKSGSIDWLCAPRFDSPACFAALLGSEEHGHWALRPQGPLVQVSRRYRGHSLVLETAFTTETGVVVVTDCMALEPGVQSTQLVRIAKCVSGWVKMQMEWVVRFDYGSVVPWVSREGPELRAIAGPETVRLYTNAPLRGLDLKTVSDFDLHAGERMSFVMVHAPSHVPAPAPLSPDYVLKSTELMWNRWVDHSTYRGPHEDAVRRSLVVLKALTYGPTGGIVAAPTTSLPERLGGSRNWDYRYCWIRDATITLHTLLEAGYSAEACAWRDWLLRAVAGSPGQAQMLYGISGERRLPEQELPWLPGYADSRPVRTGNAAHPQLQLDVFGELMDAMHQARSAGIGSDDGWSLETQLLEFLEGAWQQPDEGIWEIRGPRQHFTHSKVMAWTALDRAVRMVERFGNEGPVERWRQLRAQIHREVCERGYSRQRDSFVQSYGSRELDASLLLIPLVGFLPASDPRVVATVRAIERELLIDDCFVMRYRTETQIDGLPAGEGAFLACSYWLVTNRLMQGRHGEACELFERLLDVRNDVGLLSEEYDPFGRRLVGNFPQAFSHVALIDAAQSLAHTWEDPADKRAAPERTSARHRDSDHSN